MSHNVEMLDISDLSSMSEISILNNQMGVVSGKSISKDIPSYLAGNSQSIKKYLSRNGCLLFRGFDVLSEDMFKEIVESFGDSPLLEYQFRSTPRTELKNRVYTSTEYPNSQYIPLHNELSYTSKRPNYLYFSCFKKAEVRGNTPLADSRKVLASIPSDIVDEFQGRGVRYKRTYGVFDLPVEEVFGTNSKSQISDICTEFDIQYKWDGGVLKTWQDLPAVVKHRETGERIWFNQAHLFHVYSKGELIAQELIDEFGYDDLPRHACFADGKEIPNEYLNIICSAYKENMIEFDWEEGDLLILDNFVFAHGRTPFEGERKVVVGMTM